MAALSHTGVGILTSAIPKDTFELSVLGFVASSKLQVPFVHVYNHQCTGSGWTYEDVHTMIQVAYPFQAFEFHPDFIEKFSTIECTEFTAPALEDLRLKLHLETPLLHYCGQNARSVIVSLAMRNLEVELFQKGDVDYLSVNLFRPWPGDLLSSLIPKGRDSSFFG